MSPQIGPEVKEKVEKFLAEKPRTLADALGIELTVLSREQVCGTMPVNEATKQPFGVLHGGASVALAETLASIGAWLNADDDSLAFGLEINANHIRPVSSGTVSGVAVPLHRGKTTQVWEVRITEENGKLVCISRCTLANVAKRADSTG